MPENSVYSGCESCCPNDSTVKEAVCINAPRIYDSCSDKDCLEDLPVLFTEENQAIVDQASTVRLNDVEVTSVSIGLQSVPFHKGFYAVDMTFYFDVNLDVFTAPNTVPTSMKGLAVFSKRAVLFGSDGIFKEGRLWVNTNGSLRLSHLFTDAIAQATGLSQGDFDKIRTAFSGKIVTIDYSDNYILGLLHCQILVGLIDELKSLFSFTIANNGLTFHVKPRNEYATRVLNRYYNPQSPIRENFDIVSSRDNYLIGLGNNALGITPILPFSQHIDHHRWLRIKNTEGDVLEIRPDHGIAGGWNTMNASLSYVDCDLNNPMLDKRCMITKDYSNTDILYYVIFQKHK